MFTIISLSLLVFSFGFSAHASLELCETLGELKADSDICERFYQCTHIGWEPLYCKNGLIFNEETSVCDWPKLGTKCGQIITTGDSGQDFKFTMEPCKTVGQYKPEAYNCDNFFQCTNSGWTSLTCRAGLVFNSQTSVCDWPKSGVRCANDAYIDNQSGLKKCTTVGELKAEAENCERFYQCTRNGWSHLTCSHGLVFNPETSVCDWPKPGATCEKTTNSEGNPGYIDQDDDSMLDICITLGQLRSDADDCERFYQCTPIGWAPLHCQTGFYFNQEISVCDWSQPRTKCGKDENGDGDQSKLESCETVGELKAEAENCDRFYQCTRYGWSQLACGHGLAFNVERLVCDWPKSGDMCEKGTKSGDSDQDQDDSMLEICLTLGQLKSDAEDCERFYQCTPIGWAPLHCQTGFFFNQEISVCDKSESGNKCGKNEHDDDDNSKQEACGTVGQLKSDTESCSSFYECTITGWVQLGCPSGLYFNSEISRCDWPKAGTKCGTDSDQDDQSEVNDNDSDLESCKETGQLKADNKHCDLYYQCTSCGWSLVPCQTGLLFDPKTFVCDQAEKVTCAKDNDLEPCETLGQFKVNTKHCDTYYKCTKCGWALVMCGSGFLFNSETATCDGRDGVICAKDTGDDSKLEPCETVGQLKADSETCDHYYRCNKNGWGILPCASGLLFNSKALACENADQVKCGNESDDDDQFKNDGQDETDKLEPCDVISQLKSDPKDCKKYYQCTTYGWQNMPCYTGLVFNPNKAQCDYSYNYECSVETN